MKENLKNLEKKNLIIAGIFLISIVIILLGGAIIYNKFFYKKSYAEVEEIMLTSTKEYFTKYEEKLPKNINDSITVSVDTLVKNNNMDTIASYTKNDVTCDGEVTVTNINGDYRYATTLDCGKTYQTQTLIEYINNNVEIVTGGNGLYELNNELVYRGDNINNYLKLNGYTYRIVKIKDGHPVIIFTDTPNEEITNIQWDNRYNINTDSESGINDYEVSRIRDYLNDLYTSTNSKALLSDTTRLLVTMYDLPIGKRCNDDTDKTGNLENAKVLTNQYIGLLTVSDFLTASLDENCTNTNSKSCANYNYLNKYKYTWWTVTANSKNTYRAYAIEDIAVSTDNNSYAYVRPVFYLASDTIYVSGDGTKDNPYIIK